MISKKQIDHAAEMLWQKYRQRLYSDNYIIAKYLFYAGRYEDRIMSGEPAGICPTSTGLYIKKEAFRLLANERGYSDEVLRAERGKK